jgi:hypothetical protein
MVAKLILVAWNFPFFPMIPLHMFHDSSNFLLYLRLVIGSLFSLALSFNTIACLLISTHLLQCMGPLLHLGHKVIGINSTSFVQFFTTFHPTFPFKGRKKQHQQNKKDI